MATGTFPSGYTSLCLFLFQRGAQKHTRQNMFIKRTSMSRQSRMFMFLFLDLGVESLGTLETLWCQEREWSQCWITHVQRPCWALCCMHQCGGLSYICLLSGAIWTGNSSHYLEEARGLEDSEMTLFSKRSLSDGQRSPVIGLTSSGGQNCPFSGPQVFCGLESSDWTQRPAWLLEDSGIFSWNHFPHIS